MNCIACRMLWNANVKQVACIESLYLPLKIVQLLITVA